eukprot:2921023-Prymnesium_polylepis.1
MLVGGGDGIPLRLRAGSGPANAPSGSRAHPAVAGRMDPLHGCRARAPGRLMNSRQRLLR